MFTEKHSLISRVDHQCVFSEPGSIQIVKDTSDVFVDGFNATKVIMKVLLVRRFAFFLVGHPG